MERREFIKKGLSWAAYIFGAAALAYPVFSFMHFRKTRKKTVVFHPDEQLAAANFKEGIFLIKKGADFKALSARCTHLGCTLNFDAVSQQFKCPCHGSLFAISGKWISGPAKKDLISIPVKRGTNGDMKVEFEI
ncbi:MAG: Rieske (2Fe-2S) protein [Deltaproteobacteria bacterium]|nr:Rieske (2Fe-2S) protein [Deltaproteobacteria bacterium]